MLSFVKKKKKVQHYHYQIEKTNKLNNNSKTYFLLLVFYINSLTRLSKYFFIIFLVDKITKSVISFAKKLKKIIFLNDFEFEKLILETKKIFENY